MNRPNLKMLEFGERCKKIIDKNKITETQTQCCQLCGGYLVALDWAPTCEDCGSVHIDYQCLKFDNDDYRKPKKMLYSREGHLFSKIIKRYGIPLDSKTKTQLKYLFSKTVDIYNEIKGKRKNFLNYEYILERLFKHMNIPSPVFKQLKSKKTLAEHNMFWNVIAERL